MKSAEAKKRRAADSKRRLVETMEDAMRRVYVVRADTRGGFFLLVATRAGQMQHIGRAAILTMREHGVDTANARIDDATGRITVPGIGFNKPGAIIECLSLFLYGHPAAIATAAP